MISILESALLFLSSISSILLLCSSIFPTLKGFSYMFYCLLYFLCYKMVFIAWKPDQLKQMKHASHKRRSLDRYSYDRGNVFVGLVLTFFAVLQISIVNEKICVEKRTQKKILSSRWELNPRPSVHQLDALITELLRTQW